ncbi:MAG: helix-hairpin-helix domain-containing protein [Candidatus Zixiibacteriota bacterium]
MKTLTIVADNLLVDTPIVRLLQARGVQVTPANLTAGHYMVTGKCAILHVYSEEFARWTVEKSVYRRITEFKRTVSEPVVIVEGRQPMVAAPASPSALRGALAFVAVHNRVPILFAVDENETADFIYAMANQTQNGMGQSIEAPSNMQSPHDEGPSTQVSGGNGDTPSEDPTTLVEHIVRLIPDVGPVTARALLKRFGNLRALFAATANELTKIDGIGPKKAKKMAAFFGGKNLR